MLPVDANKLDDLYKGKCAEHVDHLVVVELYVAITPCQEVRSQDQDSGGQNGSIL